MKKTPLYERHVEYGGKMVEFGGFNLPIQYKSGIIAEHNAVRTAAGLFDVSHMGEVVLSGKDAFDNIQRLFTNDFSGMYDGQVKYSPMCNHNGGVVDDLLIYRYSENEYLIVLNAANTEKDIKWMQNNLEGDVKLRDISGETAQLALQGPKSLEILSKCVDEESLPKKYYSFNPDVEVCGASCIVSKTGYTGELGFEIYCKNNDAPRLWNELLKIGEEHGLIPCGLGARDTLRFEAGMPLYGHELNEDTTPIESGIGFFVKLDKPDFIGKAALIKRGNPKIKRVGLKIIEKSIARENCDVYYEDNKIGRTTSGNFCPTLGFPAAMAMLDIEHSDVGTELFVEVRGKKIKAQVVPIPFYKRDKK